MKKRCAFVGLIYNNSVCLAKRHTVDNGQKVPFGGYWSLFGGSIEKGESPFFAAHRELKEESSIEIPLNQLKYCKTLRGENETLHIYFAEMDQLINPILDFEHTEFGWFDINEIDSFPYLIDENIVFAIKKYQKNRYIS